VLLLLVPFLLIYFHCFPLSLAGVALLNGERAHILALELSPVERVRHAQAKPTGSFAPFVFIV
jgi:hypothetical protein